MVFRRKDNVSVPLESRITSYLTMSSNLIAVYNVLHYIIYVKPNETISNYAKDSTASTHLHFPLKSTASPRPAPTPPGKAKSERDDSAMALATQLPDASGDPKGKPKKPMKTWWKHL